MQDLFGMKLMLLLFLCNGCAGDSDKNNITALDLHGRWDVHAATRNDRSSESLLSSYFIFNDDNSISSNLLTSSDSLKFELEKKTIEVKGDQPMKFKVQYFQNDTMVLQTKLKSWKIVFNLHKSNEDSKD